MRDARRRYVVLYDGDCGFCSRWRDRLAPRDRQGRIEWLSVHDPSVAARFPGLDRDDAMRQMYVFAPDGTLTKGADGWIALSRVLHGLSFVGRIAALPGLRSLARLVYRFIAARRYRFSCQGASCRLPRAGSGAGGLVLLALCLGAAAASGSCGEPPKSALEEKLQDIGDAKAAEVLATTFEAYGGYASWAQHKNVEYQYRLEYYGGEKTPQKVTRQIHRFGLGPVDQAYLEDLEVAAPQIVRLDGDAVQVTRGGQPLSDPADLEFPRAFGQLARWSFMNPWNLLDPKCRLEYRGERTPPGPGAVPAGPCEVIRLRFDNGGKEGESTDWQDIYVSRLSHLVDRIHSYRAEDADYRVSIWSDHRKFDELRLATRRETYSSDASGAIGTLEVVAEYSEVRFDAPFGDDLFRPSVPLAASASRSPSE